MVSKTESQQRWRDPSVYPVLNRRDLLGRAVLGGVDMKAMTAEWEASDEIEASMYESGYCYVAQWGACGLLGNGPSSMSFALAWIYCNSAWSESRGCCQRSYGGCRRSPMGPGERAALR